MTHLATIRQTGSEKIQYPHKGLIAEVDSGRHLILREIADKQIFVFDGDGVLWRGNSPITGVKETLSRLRAEGRRVTLLTNNSTRSRSQFAQKACELLQYSIEEEAIVNSSYAAARFLRQRFSSRSLVLPLGEEGLSMELECAGFKVIQSVKEGQPTAVVVGMDRYITYDKIRQALRGIISGALFVATNPDPTFPTEDGFDPGAGASVGAVSGACGKAPDIIIGKPNPLILTQSLDEWGVKPRDAVMIGDRLSTDILCAQRAGVFSVLVRTGVNEPENPEIVPDLTLNDVTELFEN